MHPPFKPAPGTHSNAAHDHADRSGRLDRTKHNGILACPREQHGCQDGKADPREKVPNEKHHLQAQQAGARKNVFETKGSLLPETPFGLLSLRSAWRLRHKYERQCQDGRPKGDGIKEQNPPNTQDGDQSSCQ